MKGGCLEFGKRKEKKRIRAIDMCVYHRFVRDLFSV